MMALILAAIMAMKMRPTEEALIPALDFSLLDSLIQERNEFLLSSNHIILLMQSHLILTNELDFFYWVLSTYESISH